MRLRCRRTALRRSSSSSFTTSLIVSRAVSTYSRTCSTTSSTGIRSTSSSPRSTAVRNPRLARGPAHRAPSIARSPAHLAPSSPRLPAHFAPSIPAKPARAAPRPAYRTSGPTGRRPEGPRRSRSVIPAPTAAPIIAAVSRSYCCSRSSSSSSGPDSRARFLPTVGSVFVVVPIVPVLLVKCLIDSRLHAANRRRGRHERRFRLLLHDLQQRIQLVDPVFRRTRRLLQSLIYSGHGLAHLLYVYADRGRDVIDVVRNCAGVPHQRVDVPVDLVQHIADFLVALSEIPGRRHQRHSQNYHCDGHDAARRARDLFPQPLLGRDLFRVDRVGKSTGSLQQQFGAATDPSRHVREVCKGEAIFRAFYVTVQRVLSTIYFRNRSHHRP